MGPRLLAILAIIGAFAFGSGVGSLWRESETTCALAGVLLEDIRSLLIDGHEVVGDPFVEYAIGSDDSFLARLELERELAHRILNRFGRFHLSLGFTMDLGILAEIRTASLESSLRSLEAWRRTMHAAPDALDGDLLDRLAPLAHPGAPGIAAGESGAGDPWYADPEQARARFHRLAESEHHLLEEARTKVPALKAEWTTDSQVYCRSMLTLHRMALVQETQKQACANGDGALGKPRKRNCANAALLRFQTEVDQLERVRSLNEKKLRQKWGGKLYAGIHCD